MPPEGCVQKNNSWFEDWTPEYSVKKLCWKISQSLQENTCATVSFEQSCRPEVFNFIKKRLQHSWFAVNFAEFLETPTYSVKSMQPATSGLINSCETSKWLSYTYYHISCWMPRKFTPMLSFFPCTLIRFWFWTLYTRIHSD